MTKCRQFGRSDLYLVRLWTEETAAGSALAHGKVQRAVSGETNHFDDWQGLLDRLRAMAVGDRGDREKGNEAPDDAHAK
jgi:hypothetical protein